MTLYTGPPDVISANVSIFHPQLRDLLQPAGEKGKVLFIHNSSIQCADFNTMKSPTHFCTLDFPAVCLTTGSGLVAAGGERSELDIRPLFPLPGTHSSSSTSSSINPLTIVASEEHATAASATAGSSSAIRSTPRWHLRTPTGGSINNSICIQPERKQTSASLLGIVPPHHPGTSSVKTNVDQRQDRDACHREKRRKEDGDQPTPSHVTLAWKRDEPWGRTEDVMMSETEDKVRAASSSQKEKVDGAMKSRPMRILISNNDRSVKAFRLRPPVRDRSVQTYCSTYSERIESGLPGLSRTQTVEFPTCINHSCFSPDGRHVVSVGDTPDVFLFSVHPVSGEMKKITTYTASADASFSTSWSPDSLQFAVASQDGFVSVWDVRSSSKIASLKTIQISDRYGAGAARVVKWSPRGDVLAFSEQLNYVHIVDTLTFEVIQQLRIPSQAHASSTSGLLDSTCEDSMGTQGGLDADDVLFLGSESGERPLALNDETHLTTNSEVRSNEPTSGDNINNNNNDVATLNGGDEWLESTSPVRFASSSRASGGARATAASLSRPWSNGRRYRDIGNTIGQRPNTLDRATLSDWTNVYRREPTGNATATHPTGSSGTAGDRINATSRAPSTNVRRPTLSDFLPDHAQPSRTYAEAAGPRTGNSEIDWLQRSRELMTASLDDNVDSVDSILAHLSNEIRSTSPQQTQSLRQRTSNVWSLRPAGMLGRLRGARQRTETDVEISGLTWDPDGDYLYVSTANSILRYAVVDTRSSLAQASIR